MERTNLPDQQRKKEHTKWKDENVKWGFRLALLGLNNREMAKAFDVEQVTLDSWIREKPEFKNALWRGKVFADAKVAAAVYKVAVGYKVMRTKLTPWRGDVIKTEYEEEILPDGEVGLKWLNVRQRNNWSIRTESLNIHANIDKLLFSELTDEELRAIQRVTMTRIIPPTGDN